MSQANTIHQGSWFKKISKNGKWYFLSSLFTKGSALLLFKVYTMYLTKEQLGAFGTINFLGGYLALFCTISMESALSRYLHESTDKTYRSNLFSTIFWFSVFWGLIISIFFISTSFWWLPQYYHISAINYALIGFLPFLFMQLANLGIIYLGQNLESFKISLYQILASIAGILISIGLLTIFKYGLMSRFIGEAIKYGVLFILTAGLFINRGILKFYFSRALLFKSFKFSFPLLPSVIAPLFINYFGSLIVAQQSLSDAASYSLAISISTILYFVQDSITQVLSPVITSGLASKDDRLPGKIRDFSLLIFAVLVMLNAGLFVYGKQMIKLFANRNFLDSVNLIIVLGFAQLVMAQNRIFSTIMLYYGKTWRVTAGNVGAAVITVCLSLWLIPQYGYTSAVWISLAALTLNFFWNFFQAQLLYPIKLDYLKMIVVSTLFTVLFLSVNYAQKMISGDYIFFAVKSLIFVSMAAFLVWYLKYTTPLKEFIASQLNTWAPKLLGGDKKQ